MFNSLNIYHNAKIPDIKHRATIIAITIAMIAIGYWLSYSMADPKVFSRVGNLVAIVAASYAFWGSLDTSDIDNWRTTWIANGDVQADVQSFSLNAKADGRMRILEGITSPMSASGVNRLCSLVNQNQIDKPTYKDFYEIVSKFKDSPNKDALVRNVNRKLYTTEFLVGCAGILVAGFGDLLVWIPS